ncbi:hypothetical protein HFM15_001597 [Vibrio cholerae]|nr:hypothetical protein [Vibrio cholerae]
MIYIDDVPSCLLNWSRAGIVDKCLAELDKPLREILSEDINQPITSIGSTLLHIAASNLNHPSVTVSFEAIETLLVLGANPNVSDCYGRTPFVNLLVHSTSSLHNHEDTALLLVELFINHNANPNVYFTPNYVSHAGCDKWTLAHDLQADMHGASRWPLPSMVKSMLNQELDFSLPDSEGRLPLNNHLA